MMAKVNRGLKELLPYAGSDFIWNTMFQDVTKYVKDYPQCQIVKGNYTKPNTILGVIIASNPTGLMCIDFTKMDHLKDVKENILISTDTFTTFSHAFVTPNQKVITIVKLLVDKWFYVYGIPACIFIRFHLLSAG